jgi:hypothetical protein
LFQFLGRGMRWFQETRELHRQLRAANTQIVGLTEALGKKVEEMESSRYHQSLLVGAIALQQGGEIILPFSLLDVVEEEDYTITLTVNHEEKTLRLQLDQSPPEEPDSCP